MRTLPNWNDEAGIAKLVGEIVAAWEAKLRYFHNFAEQAISGDEFSRFKHAERTAVEAALRGEPLPLGELLRSENQEWLEPETRELMIEFITGERNPRTGKRKGEPGARKMTADERWEASPIHRAAGEVRLLKRQFRRLYPSQSSAAVRERSVQIAAGRAGITPESLRAHLNRSRNAPHRIK
jgi:hypothetical protein